MSEDCPSYNCCGANPYDYSSSTGSDPTPPEPPPTQYGNTEQQATASCPDGYTGSPVTITIPADTYFADTQGEANTLALNAATTQANAELDCVLNPDCFNLVPEMTGPTTPSGVASASSSDPTTPAWMAFDKKTTPVPPDANYWQTIIAYPHIPGLADLPAWLQYQFAAAIAINQYTVQNYNSAVGPSWFSFQGSNNGSTWTTLDTQTNLTWGAVEKKSFSFTNSTAYAYYRLYVTDVFAGGVIVGPNGGASGAAGLVVAEMEMLSCGEDNSTDLIQFANGNMTPALIYPSIKQVSGFSGPLSSVTVQLTNILHRAPEAMAIVLEAPDGTSVMLFSHAGNGQRYFDPQTTIIFDDSAPTTVPVDTGIGAIPADSYQCTVGAGRNAEQFPGAAPIQPYSTSLAAFTGSDPNGAWRLWCIHRFFYTVFDPAYAKIINGWTLNLS